jgi:hypothetical protein
MNFFDLSRRASELVSTPLVDPQRPLQLSLWRNPPHALLADAWNFFHLALRSSALPDLAVARVAARTWTSTLDGRPVREGHTGPASDFELLWLMQKLELCAEPTVEAREWVGLSAEAAAAVGDLMALGLPDDAPQPYGVIDGHVQGLRVFHHGQERSAVWKASGPAHWQPLCAAHQRAWAALQALNGLKLNMGSV